MAADGQRHDSCNVVLNFRNILLHGSQGIICSEALFLLLEVVIMNVRVDYHISGNFQSVKVFVMEILDCEKFGNVNHL